MNQIASHLLCIFGSFFFGAILNGALTRKSLEGEIAKLDKSIARLRKGLTDVRQIARELCREGGDPVMAALDECLEAADSAGAGHGTLEELGDPLERNYR